MSWIADLRYSVHHACARAALIACALSIGAAAVAVVAWWPVRQTSARLEAQIDAKRRDLVRMHQAQEVLHAYTRARKSVGLLEKKLRQAATQAQLVENLARLARKHGVHVVSETYEEGRGSPATLNADLAVQGSYRALRDFMRDLPALPTWSEAQEVWLEKMRGSRLIKGRFRIVTYRGTATAANTP